MVEGSAFFLFCHDDVRLEPDAVQMMVEAAFRTNAGVVTRRSSPTTTRWCCCTSARPVTDSGRARARGVGRDRPRSTGPRARRLRRARGHTLVRSDLFATLRGFDPLIPVLGEDLDLCWRAQIAGARIVVARRPRSHTARPSLPVSGRSPHSVLVAPAARTYSADTSCWWWRPGGVGATPLRPCSRCS